MQLVLVLVVVVVVLMVLHRLILKTQALVVLELPLMVIQR